MNLSLYWTWPAAQIVKITFLATHPPSDNLTSHSRRSRRRWHLRQRFARAFGPLFAELLGIRLNAAAAKLFIVEQKYRGARNLVVTRKM
jgi:hypothetical protein